MIVNTVSLHVASASPDNSPLALFLEIHIVTVATNSRAVNGSDLGEKIWKLSFLQREYALFCSLTGQGSTAELQLSVVELIHQISVRADNAQAQWLSLLKCHWNN
ncbi:hypothetical protein BGAL_0341g00120 [Botrytis galanthina]|uniref:Uncharacterized protein n=1 Tax=Botrytis galanthina TaxID=278940 RepID=A0A4S8QS12_9HELO|nr:hypothetical protein BGAL_0341g00120 [Botrytis galanthina]